MQRHESTRNFDDQTVPDRAEILSPQEYDAVIFEVDGVIANTTQLHFRAWKETFDAMLRAREGRNFDPFNREEFRQFVDGKPRQEAIESLLDSRGITLPMGGRRPQIEQTQTHETDSIYGLSNMKQRNFVQRIESGQLQANSDAVELLEQLVRVGIKIAAVSTSEHAHRVLSILDLEPYFDEIVDAQAVADEGLRGKPTSDIFMEATSRLGVTRDRAVIIENDRPVVEAGRGAGFGLIVVLARNPTEQREFLTRGADLAIGSPGDLRVPGGMG